MNVLIDFFNATAFTAFGAPTTWLECIGFISGAICVWLVARENIWNWPVGLIQVLAYLVLFWNYGLFADSMLQVLYIGLAIWGWMSWKHGGANRAALPIRNVMRPELLVLLMATVALSLAIFLLLTSHTPSTTPIPDAVTTALSLVATYAQARKIIESWWFWIAADVVYVPLYLYKSLWLTGVLYLGFLALCIYGLMQWRKLMVAGTARG